MKVEHPTDYKVTFTATEMDIMRNAHNVLMNMSDLMLAHKCTELEGGYNECPVNFSKDYVDSTLEFFVRFLGDTPHTMY